MFELHWQEAGAGSPVCVYSKHIIGFERFMGSGLLTEVWQARICLQIRVMCLLTTPCSCGTSGTNDASTQ